jgi:hypothetical protein
MRLCALAILASCLCLMSVQGVARGAKAARSNKLEGMDYISARKIILSHGWKPVGGPCDGVLASSCTRFPEIEVCSVVYPGHCSTRFVRGRGCLSVITIGAVPGGYWAMDTLVDQVSFGRGSHPCAKTLLGE